MGFTPASRATWVLTMLYDEMQSYIVPTVIAILSLAAVQIYRSKRNALPLPPGPRRLPVIGSALKLPKEREWLAYEQWAREHGMLNHMLIIDI